MALYQTSVLNKYLSEQDRELVLNQYSIFKNYFLNTTIQENIIASKEEEFQEGFLRELFVKVLGYTINPEPNFNLITELKNEKDSKKADGAIKDGDKVLAVIELKSTKTTDFNKIEIQAFNYKNNQANCKYVITSNFQKIRFYIDNAIEFLEWDLFKLDIESFKLLFLCLHKDSIFKNIPATIKTESLTVEDNVTKKLYKEYSQFRKSLFNNIVELNPSIDKLLVFKKTQKLLDRFLFLFFAEDRMLVPPNSVRIILDQWNNLKDMDAYQPLYDRFKLYFGYLNTGHKGKLHDIFAYNGGLFAPDEILDTIKMDDSILYDATLSLSNYDYNSEVDVNILGHIFEHSLTEIEELEKEITNTEIVENKTTKRKKDGVFYTPKYITKYIVENTIGTLCKNKKEEIKLQEEDYHKLTKKAKKQLYDNLMQYREWLLHVTIIDPACGSGAFLNQALEFLIAEHRWIAELEANIFNAPMVFDVESSILENNLFGVDINEESVEIAKLSLWLRTARKGRKLNSLNNNIKCGNSLIDDPAVAGDKAFNWQEQFPQIFDKGGFDVVIGNPPYGAKLDEAEKLFINSQYVTFSQNQDIYSPFYQKANSIISSNGIFGLITPVSWQTGEKYFSLRNYLKENVRLVIAIKLPYNVFADAYVDTGIYIYNKRNINTNNTSKVFEYPVNFPSLNDIDNTAIFSNLDNSIWENFNNMSLVLNPSYYKLDSLLNNDILRVSEISKSIRGILPNEDAVVSIQSKDNHKKYFIGDVYRYTSNNEYAYVEYGQNLKEKPNDYNYFIGERILIRRIINRQFRIMCNYFENEFVNKKDLYILKITDNKFSTKYVLSLMNSSLFSYIKTKGSTSATKDDFSQLTLNDIRTLPIKKISSERQIPFINNVDSIIMNNIELNNLTTQFQKLLTSKFEKININNKLEKWYELSFADFNKELTKQKIKLSLSEQSEWLTFFEQEKQKALAIKNEMYKTDKEIDQMVYQLYGLTEEEIKIVEGK
jgi:type I restriction-modification system DNA methylase subunit